VTGLAFLDDGRLVGSARGDALASCVGTRCAVLLEIDPSTGGATLLGEIGDNNEAGQCGRMPDLTYDPTTRTLFGHTGQVVGIPCAFQGLWTIDPDGTEPLASFVGPNAEAGDSNGFAREPATGTLFYTPANTGCDCLVTVDPATGAGTVVAGTVGTIPFDGVPALAVHPLTGALWGARDDFAELIRINTATGATEETVDVTLSGAPLPGLSALAFEGPGGCPDAPLGSCTDSARAKLSLKAKKGQLKLDLKKLGATTKADFGDPVPSTGHAVCLYASDTGNPTLVAGYGVSAGAGWKDQKKGFQFKSKTGDPDGITKAKLKEGTAGKGQAFARGKGATLPTLPLPNDVVGQIVNDVGSCFGATVSATKPKQNTSEKYNGQKK
jgi:hypothetical protein